MAKIKLNIEIDEEVYKKLKEQLDDTNKFIPIMPYKTVEEYIAYLLSTFSHGVSKFDKNTISKMKDTLFNTISEEGKNGDALDFGNLMNMYDEMINFGKNDNKKTEDEKKDNKKTDESKLKN
ncbi:MAG: hypothetical protein LBD05_01310 [Mycoplasmataceae bacterium]|jgi:hypothetical protein|nr:hypothetical protein [Mycoplasmataceae bacterium]